MDLIILTCFGSADFDNQGAVGRLGESIRIYDARRMPGTDHTGVDDISGNRSAAPQDIILFDNQIRTKQILGRQIKYRSKIEFFISVSINNLGTRAAAGRNNATTDGAVKQV